MKYVVELARALANMEGVHRVDLLTRQITSPDVDYTYGEPIEMLSCPPDGFGSCGAYVVRIPCGPSHKYFQQTSVPLFSENLNSMSPSPLSFSLNLLMNLHGIE